jgi:Kef-type K+ transport system membrane component KefB
MHHGDPIAPVILTITGILFFALLGRFGARKLNQPSVLGELIIGILLGNLLYFLGSDLIVVLREGTAIFNMLDLSLQGHTWAEAADMSLPPDVAERVTKIMSSPDSALLMQVSHTVDVFSRYGVIFLLFLVGLETGIDEMRQVRGDSLRVALIGMLCPVVLGFVAMRILIPEIDSNTDIFVAATLSATSIGITASVLKELHQIQRREARVVLGAAVIDDILSLIMLAVVSGIVVSGEFAIYDLLKITLLSAAFLIGSIVLGPRLLKLAIGLVHHMNLAEAKLFISFLFVMLMAWLATLVGLATIVGAFTAGLILQDAYFTYWGAPRQHNYNIKELVAPLEAIMVPIFFVLMGLQVKLETVANVEALFIAMVLLVAAIIGKLLSGIGARRPNNRLLIGIGMMPRGEVGLIFVSIGKTLNVIDDRLFSAIVIMIIVTTLATPPLLKWKLKKAGDEEEG